MIAIFGRRSLSLAHLRTRASCSAALVKRRWVNDSPNQSNEKSRSHSTSGSPTPCEVNLVGPRHYRSNIRKIVYAKSKDETTEEKKFREEQQDLNSWHHMFWEQQNETFQKSKKAYLQVRTRDLDTETNKKFADEMSLFYKDFLDGNHKRHSQYLREWYQRNFKLLWTGLHVSVSRLYKKIIQKRLR